MKRSDPEAVDVPHTPDPIANLDPVQVIQALQHRVTPERLARMRRVIAQRSHDLSVVLENISDPHNASAILRSADAFGFHRVHLVDDGVPLRMARNVAKGSHRWLHIQRHPTAEACIAQLKDTGHRVYTASMEGAVPIDALLGQPAPLAIVFGNEHAGPSTPMRALADGVFAIPMHGFAESLNVSVAAAITLYTLRKTHGRALPQNERNRILAHYLRQDIRDAEHFLRVHPSSKDR